MSGVDSSYAWWRLVASVTLSMVGGVGMWCLVVALPSVQQDLGVSRADISFAYTVNTLGFFVGGVVMGKLVDARGIVLTAVLSAIGLTLGFAAAPAGSFTTFTAAQALIGFSGAATFAPLVADVSHWFEKRRGMAVAIAASGNYLAGTVWPPIIEGLIRDHGWRATYWVAAGVCILVMIPLALVLRRPAPLQHTTGSTAGAAAHSTRSLGLSPNALQAVLVVAGIGCCVAMSMPQVHIVAYCADLGYGVARGAEMLSLMLGFGIISRIASGWIADRVGGIKTLLLGSTLQCVALVFYLIDDSLNSLYVASALFGLFQGGIVPSYAIIVREYFPPQEAGFRVGLAISSTLVGMALGGWMGGVLFDMTGSYRAAFINGIAWNLLNGAIAWWLLFRQTRRNVYA
ncbi:MAG: MFS transporter [Reyranella sp.]|jgi:MFS family permease|uniref:MFS transporter n=1 Tax=Reyranella sp. TaxID=1929291 RepID=UPI00095B8E11|nr:MFS transporter [Reyranella sp.]MBN9538754.1 MFS transporter [Alphaproteobacteria bacterium]MBR2814026.1 MFS transporter [Reyranella sp.]OJU33598.1 MAG: MFS transporter [Alphaproteobacteria bacterium 65-37]